MADTPAAQGDAAPKYTTVGITVSAWDALTTYCDKHQGKNARDVVSALVMRFLSVEPPVRTALIGPIDEGMELAYAELLEAMASEIRVKADAVQAAKRFKIHRKGATTEPSPPPAPNAKAK
jgi:hypothetical protein